ncbi:MAG: monooxygenase [Deltaproteobacteria bacterium]|nr:MAG: monooxygenase [Deltaproteobacteria bacterium]
MRSRPLLALLALTACGGGKPTYYADAKPIIDARCATCHQEGDIAPFPLTNWEEVEPQRGIMEFSIRAGTMPPWQAADGCNDYENDFSLTPEEESVLLAWFDADAPMGKPEHEPEPVEAAAPWPADLSLQLPEAYTPTREPDDYRCQIIEWPLEEEAFITGVRVQPDQRALVHHTILFAIDAADADTYRAMDAAEEGPGYTCFGGPTSGEGMIPEGATLQEILEMAQNGELEGGSRWLGSWVPGAEALPFPEGTGLRMRPGDLVVVQMHYNTLSAAPVADQSSVELSLADAVAKEAYVLPVTNPGWVTGVEALGGTMDIPAGESDVSHTAALDASSMVLGRARTALGLPEDSDLVAYTVGHHMHQLGTWGRQSVVHEDGTETCMVQIDDWDFAWQGAVHLSQPVTITPTDTYELSCGWDNSAENQPVIDGQVLDPQDVTWGEGTTDEMCLSTLYVTGP